MSKSVDELYDAIRALDPADRRELFRIMVADLDGPMEPDIERAWLEEAERRYTEYRKGKVQSVPASDVFAQARSRLNR